MCLIVQCTLSGLQSLENCEPGTAVSKLSQHPRELRPYGGSREPREAWPPGRGNWEPAWPPAREKGGEAAWPRGSTKKRHGKALRSVEKAPQKAVKKSPQKAARNGGEKWWKIAMEKWRKSRKKAPYKMFANWEPASNSLLSCAPRGSSLQKNSAPYSPVHLIWATTLRKLPTLGGVCLIVWCALLSWNYCISFNNYIINHMMITQM